MLKYPSIAVDFDGTLGYSNHRDYPKITKVFKYPINVLNEYKSKGGICILWTCRQNLHLQYAVEALKENGLTFDAINENTEEAVQNWLKRYPNSGISPKIFTSLYIEDRALFGYPQKLDWNAIRKTILTEKD